MTKNKKIKSLAVVPARGGSKRLPGKYISDLNGKPLVCYTIEAALKSNCFDKIILSSDDENILKIADSYDGVDAEHRPARLAGDNVKVLELMCEIADRKDLAEEFDVIALLLPTAVFRQASDIKEGFKLFSDDMDSVVSVTLYEFPPQLSIKVDEESGFLVPVFDPSPLITGETRSQDQAPILRPNGGFYMSWWKSFVVNRNYFKGKVKAYEMSRLSSVDIDELSDMQYAQFLLDSKNFVLED